MVILVVQAEVIVERLPNGFELRVVVLVSYARHPSFVAQDLAKRSVL